MWLVLGAPLVVVVASLTTGYIAWVGADRTVSQSPSAAQTAKGTATNRSAAPAQQGRNHAATPVGATQHTGSH